MEDNMENREEEREPDVDQSVHGSGLGGSDEALDLGSTEVASSLGEVLEVNLGV